ncbi:MAG TPA: T9SS type A sorting domain-containing protein [Bacteroidales bacterium]|nr:T9SS type A sorting domain-containing protein [Bacteroidales bacterium]
METKLKFLLPIFFLFVAFLQIKGQTNISGNISINTVWTTKGSPYIIIDTVIVTGGVILTLKPGIIVRFRNGAELRINYSSIVAIGTPLNPITFTSDSPIPHAGIWSTISINGGDDTLSTFNYCNFEYAAAAIRNNGGVLSLLKVKNCNFNSNVIGINDIGWRAMAIDSCNFKNNTEYGLFELESSTISNCNISNNKIGISAMNIGGYNVHIDNCMIDLNQIGIEGLYPNSTIKNSIIRSNQYGIIFKPSNGYISLAKGNLIDSNKIAGIVLKGGFTIDSCQIRYNGIGIIDSGGINQNIIIRNKMEYNSSGIILGTSKDIFRCNKICNNTLYDLKSITLNDIKIPDNFWCSSDSLSILEKISDGNDTSSLGIVKITPLDTVQCCDSSNVLVINKTDGKIIGNSILIFPNPVSDYLTLALKPNISEAEIKVFNIIGGLEYSTLTNRDETIIDVTYFKSGLHIIQIIRGNSIIIRKFIKK